MRHAIFIGLLWGLTQLSNGQNTNKIEFVDYNQVIEEINSSSNITDLKNKWDYNSILLLDSTQINRINEIRPDIVKDFREFSSYPIPDENKGIITMAVNSIKDCFIDENLRNLIIASFNYEDLKYPIYIKDAKSAVFEIEGDGLHECKRITLTEKGIIIEMITTAFAIQL